MATFLCTELCYILRVQFKSVISFKATMLLFWLPVDGIISCHQTTSCDCFCLLLLRPLVAEITYQLFIAKHLAHLGAASAFIDGCFWLTKVRYSSFSLNHEKKKSGSQAAKYPAISTSESLPLRGVSTHGVCTEPNLFMYTVGRKLPKQLSAASINRADESGEAIHFQNQNNYCFRLTEKKLGLTHHTWNVINLSIQQQWNKLHLFSGCGFGCPIIMSCWKTQE